MQRRASRVLTIRARFGRSSTPRAKELPPLVARPVTRQEFCPCARLASHLRHVRNHDRALAQLITEVVPNRTDDFFLHPRLARAERPVHPGQAPGQFPFPPPPLPPIPAPPAYSP